MVEIEQTLEHSQISQLYLVLQHEKSIYLKVSLASRFLKVLQSFNKQKLT